MRGFLPPLQPSALFSSRRGRRAAFYGLSLLLILVLLLGQRAYNEVRFAGSSSEISLINRLEGTAPMLRPIREATVADLAQTLETLDYNWPPTEPVPAIAVEALPNNLADATVTTRKSVFFRTLLPLVMAENERLRGMRQALESVFAQGPLPDEGPVREAIQTLATRYQVEGDLDTEGAREALLHRIDEIPASLMLAQAVNESGWGTSRFAREANNLFGVWTWQEDAGLVPENRPEGATYRVRIFDDLQTSVRNYLFTLNRGQAYAGLRERRAQARQAGDPITGLDLAQGLSAYSERGEAYVESIQALIRGNNLQELGDLSLRVNQ